MPEIGATVFSADGKQVIAQNSDGREVIIMESGPGCMAGLLFALFRRQYEINPALYSKALSGPFKYEG